MFKMNSDKILNLAKEVKGGKSSDSVIDDDPSALEELSWKTVGLSKVDKLLENPSAGFSPEDNLKAPVRFFSEMEKDELYPRISMNSDKLYGLVEKLLEADDKPAERQKETHTNNQGTPTVQSDWEISMSDQETPPPSRSQISGKSVIAETLTTAALNSPADNAVFKIPQLTPTMKRQRRRRRRPKLLEFGKDFDLGGNGDIILTKTRRQTSPVINVREQILACAAGTTSHYNGDADATTAGSENLRDNYQMIVEDDNVSTVSCSIRCPNIVFGTFPDVQCESCLLLFHAKCVGLPSNDGSGSRSVYSNGFSCSNCTKEKEPLTSTKCFPLLEQDPTVFSTDDALLTSQDTPSVPLNQGEEVGLRLNISIPPRNLMLTKYSAVTAPKKKSAVFRFHKVDKKNLPVIPNMKPIPGRNVTAEMFAENDLKTLVSSSSLMPKRLPQVLFVRRDSKTGEFIKCSAAPGQPFKQIIGHPLALRTIGNRMFVIVPPETSTNGMGQQEEGLSDPCNIRHACQPSTNNDSA